MVEWLQELKWDEFKKSSRKVAGADVKELGCEEACVSPAEGMPYSVADV